MSRASLLLLALLGTLAPAVAFAQPSAAPGAETWAPATESFPAVRQRQLHSVYTGRDYRILVSRPETPPPAAGFPILYVLDGHTAFPFAALIARERSERGPVLGIDPGIVVGIVHLRTDTDPNPRADDFTPPAADLADTGDFSGNKQGGADRFLDFLETELKPLLAAEFKIDATRQTLFGHSYGGLFTLHTLFTRPAAFQHYVAASPSIWWNHRHVLTERDAFLKTALPELLKTGSPPSLVLSVGDQEQTPLPHHLKAGRAEMLVSRRMVDNARDLSALLAAVGLPTRLYLFENENHGTARTPALNHAVRVAFGE
jgi:uncharacterized protein